MRRLLAVILFVVSLLTFVSCNARIKDYRGKPIINLSFETIDYNGGYTVTYIFDFEQNVVKYRVYIPSYDEESKFTTIKNFSDAEEEALINKLYSYGLFSLKDNYKNLLPVFDGGGWNLTVEYSDGTSKKSIGSNSSPTGVFSNCAKAFFDICGEGIVARVPQAYYRPPNVSYAFRRTSGFMGYSQYGELADYKWNGFESSGNDIYEINRSTDFSHKFYDDEKYTFVLYTSNYGDYDKFKKCIVTCYDNNEDLTNKTVDYSDGWFKQIEFDLQLNKIYLVRFEFGNGDFAEYTFNTNTTTKDGQ